MPHRSGAYTVHVDVEITGTDTFGTRNSDFNDVAKGQPCWDVSAVPRNASIEHQGQKRDFGRLPYAVGLPEAPAGFSTYLEGLGTAAGDGIQAAMTFLALCFEVVFGSAAKRNYGSNVASGTDEGTIVQESEVTSFGSGDVIAYVLNDDVTIECRPIDSSSTVNHTLAIEASEVLDEGNVIHGTTCVKWVNPTTVLGRRLQMQARGLSDKDTWEVYGAWLSAVFNSVSRGECQTLSFSGMGSAYDYDRSSSLTLTSAVRPVCAAVSHFLIAPAGSEQTPVCPVVWNWSLDFGISATAVPPACEGSHDQAASGWVITADPTLTITLAHDETAAAAPSDDWFDAFEDDSLYQIFWYEGAQAGKIAGCWAKSMRLAGHPEHGETDGIRTQTLTFKPVSYTADPLFTFFQA